MVLCTLCLAMEENNPEEAFEQHYETSVDSNVEHFILNVFADENISSLYNNQATVPAMNQQLHERPWKCTWGGCGKRFKRKHNGIEHIRRVHTKEKHYICKYCNEGFVRADDRKKHVDNQHSTLINAIQKLAKKMAKESFDE